MTNVNRQFAVSRHAEYLTRAEDIPAYGKVRTRFLGTVAAICAALAFAVAGLASAHGVQAETVTPKFDQVIPNIPGKSLIVVEVDYAPGAASRPHRHAKSAFIYAYVISGEIESKVNNGETRTYKAGESWSEPPNANHPISRNASKTKPAKLLAVFVVDSDDKRRARLNCISHLLSVIPYEDVGQEKVKLPERQKAHGYEEPKNRRYNVVPEVF